MAKKKFNPDAAFQAMVKPAANEQRGESFSAETSKPKTKLIQTGFYITEKQHKALKLKAITEDSDQSEIIRELIDKNLKQYL